MRATTIRGAAAALAATVFMALAAAGASAQHGTDLEFSVDTSPPAGTPFPIEVAASTDMNTHARLRVAVHPFGEGRGCAAVPPLIDEDMPPGSRITRSLSVTRPRGRHVVCALLTHPEFGVVAERQQVIDVGERRITLKLDGPARAKRGKRVRLTASGTTDGVSLVRVTFVRGRRCPEELRASAAVPVKRELGIGDYRFTFTRRFRSAGTWRACGYVNASFAQRVRDTLEIRVRRR